MTNPQTLFPQIIFEDTHLLVLAKPAGLLSQGESQGEPNLVDWLRGYLGRPYVGLIHRLDRNTSGIMIVGKRTKSARRLTESLKAGELRRTYLGWVEGTLVGSVRWAHRLTKDEARNITRVAKASDIGKASALRATARARGQWRGLPVTLVEFELETGRSHQIRAQSSHEGHPLLGDAKYGASTAAAIARPALHSFRLECPHPMSGDALRFEALLPPDFVELSRVTGAKPIP